MNSDPNCIFCQIVAKKKPEEILYEDDQVICFLDRGSIWIAGRCLERLDGLLYS